jgi:hypothetical protein
VARGSLLNKFVILVLLVFLWGCSPSGLVLVNRNDEKVHLKVSVLDFHNHSSTSNPRLGRELAERLSYYIFSHSKGEIEIVERNCVKSVLHQLDLSFSHTFSKNDLVAIAESLKVDFLIKGTVIGYETGVMEDKNSSLEVLISIISSKDGFTAAMLKVKKESRDPKMVVEILSREAGKRIVQEREKLYELINPPLADTSHAG